MTYSELITKRRSIRDFEDKPVPSEIIHEILQEACLAPSACNMQPWKFIVVQKQEMLKKISDEAKRYGLEMINKYPESPFCRFKNIYANPDYYIFYNAPALILVVGENNYPFFNHDCSCATTYLMFAATARGLGTCWIGHAHMLEDKALRTEIGLPDNYEISAAIIIGYPKSIPQITQRNGLAILKFIEQQIA